MSDILLTLSAVILLPLIPACILYILLPSKTMVKGPFKGLNINLQGAFGGYFLVLLIAVSFINFYNPKEKPAYELWKVKGTIKFSDNIGSISNVDFLQEPSMVIHKPNGTFEMTVLTKPDYENRKKLPDLVFTHAGYITETVNIEQYQKGAEDKIIEIKNPIILNREPAIAYNPDNAFYNLGE